MGLKRAFLYSLAMQHATAHVNVVGVAPSHNCGESIGGGAAAAYVPVMIYLHHLINLSRKITIKNGTINAR